MVSGGNLTPTCQIYLDTLPQVTTYISPTTLSFVVDSTNELVARTAVISVVEPAPPPLRRD